MGQLLLVLVVALTVAAVVFGVTVLVSGRDPGLVPAEPDGRAVPLPGGRPLAESDIGGARFDTALRGYRMDQVDQALRRAAYDIGYKSELIGVLEAEVDALRAGRADEAEKLRESRLAAAATAATPADATTSPAAGDPATTSPAATDSAASDPATSDAATGEPADRPEVTVAGTGEEAGRPDRAVSGEDQAGTDRAVAGAGEVAGRPDVAVRSESA
ncbi:DivIVA domain-containing protein [Micromonospora cathayae]|uniref:DivIVA domain-containing protein n=1 Tax=Micromonospora cathayae TaxID=3028804 RepID=A0ABY7ZUB1_9ACTN|nr:DivIVA domain-containing protein [Micromonospora sp. HUAS 3]WDZ86631.1 DivIVA domain-containing protein [Micromonospora sp. HUAS 3]